MSKFNIYSKDGKDIRYSGYPKYNGSYLKVSFLEFGTISGSRPIPWQVGDYVDYKRTGKRYRLYAIPQLKKQARPHSSGDAFVYQGVKFQAKTHDLETSPFRDYVKKDNRIHFSTRSAVSTYENVYGVAERIQANLDEFYPGEWDIRVYGNLDEDFRNRIKERRYFSVDGSCLDACDKMYEIWGIGWLHIVENGKDVLLFGKPDSREEGNTSDVFVYGKGKGLTAIQKAACNIDDMATRLYVYGSTRNMTPGYYNELAIKDAESVDIQHLMIPVELWGKTDGLPDASKAYIENTEAVRKYGLIPKSVYFDGGDKPEIFPSIKEMTIDDVRSVMSPEDKYYPKDTIYDGTERIDQIKDVVNHTDNESADFPTTITSPEVYNRIVNAYDYQYYFFESIEISQPGAYKFESTQEISLTQLPNLSKFRFLYVIYRYYDQQGGYKDIKETVIAPNKQGYNLESGEYSNYKMEYYDLSFDVPEDIYQDGGTISLLLKITKDSSPSAENITFSITGETNILARRTESKPDFLLYVRQLGFDINEQTALGNEGKCTVAMNTGACAGRQFSVISAKYREEKDDWELGMKYQTDESLDKQFPNTQYPIAKEDIFVLLDIAMPNLYISLNERRLYKEGAGLYETMSKPIPRYEPSIDPIVMAREKRSLSEGMYMHIQDSEVIESVDDYVLIDTLVISEDEAEIPTYKVTLQEKKRKSFQQTTNEAISDLKEKTDDLEPGGTINVEYANRAGSANYASDADRWSGHRFSDMMNQPVRTGDSVFFDKVGSEEVVSDRTVTDEVVSRNYRSGIFGEGHRLGRENDGDSILEIDNIIVRKALTVFELLIQQAKHQGGIVFYTVTSVECTDVEEVATGYKCHFDTKNGSVPNLFVVGDQARCQRFAMGTTTYKYYWRYVSEVGDDYIVLSMTDCDEGSGIPEKGDNIIQLGNRTDKKRQSAQILSAYGDNAPSYEAFNGINSYSLAGKNTAGIVTDSETGESRFYCYGESYIGDRDLSDPDATFMTFQQKEGSDKKELFVQANMRIGAGSSGLTNLSEWSEKQQQIDKAQEAADKAQETADNVEVGGVNLFDGTSDEFEQKKIVKWIRLYQYFNLTKGKYTVSIDVYADIENPFRLYFEATPPTVPGQSYDFFLGERQNLPTENKRYEYTVDFPADYEEIRFYLVVNELTTETQGNLFFRRLKFEKGNKATSWSPSPKDVKEDIDKVQSATDAANKAITDIKNFTDTAFADGVINRAEAAAIEKYKNTVNETKSSSDALYTELYNNPQLSGTPKSNLAAAKTAFDVQCTELLSAIDVAIADNVASAAEKASVDAAYSAFNEAYEVFSQRIEEASDAIRGVINDTANNAQNTANTALGKANEAKDYIDNTLPEELAEINRKLDGVVESFFLPYSPTLENEPAATWIKDGTQAKHEGDTFLNNQEFIDIETTPDSGKAWKWTKRTDGTFYWNPVADSDSVKALQMAAAAQDTADAKRRCFVNTPFTPYEVGDIWMQGSGGEIMRCIVSRESGAYTASDWDKGSKYTDDTYAKERFEAMAEDGVITKEEKSSLRNILVQIQKEFVAYQTDADSFGVSITALHTAYTNITTYMTGTLAVNNDTDTTVTEAQRTTYNTYMAAYTFEVTRLSNVIAQKKADDAVNNISVGGRNLAIYYSLITQNSEVDGYAIKQTVVGTTTDKPALQIHYGESIYPATPVWVINTRDYIIGKNHYKFRTPIESEIPFTFFRIKYNDAKKDFGVWFKTDLKLDTEYVITLDIVNFTQGEYEFKDVMLVEGNKSIDFSPSPEDVQYEIDNAKNTANSALIKVDTEYYLSDSPLELQGGNWTTVAPDWEQGKYIWSRNKTTTGSGLETYSEPVCITGNTGSAGSAGVGIASIVNYYARSKSQTVIPTDSEFSTNVPTLSTTYKVMWNYELITYSDGTEEKTSKRVIGVYGNTGSPGKDGTDGIDGKTPYFHVKYANDANGSGMNETGGDYIGTYTDFVQEDSTDPKKYIWVKTKGEQGIPGVGIDGKTSYLHIAYANSADGKQDFSTTDSANKSYIGQYSDFNVNDSNVYSDYSWTKIKGEQGIPGTDGKGIKSTEVKYQASTSGTTAPTGTWSTTIPQVAANQYLWTRTITTYTDDTTVTAYSVGKMGATGTPGNDGASVGSIVEYYLATSASSGVTTGTSGWTTSIQTITNTKKYLWNYEIVKDTNDNTISTSTPVIIGVYGQTGDTGKGISKIEEQYAENQNADTAPTSGWSTTAINWKDGYYVWTRSKITWTDDTVTYTTPINATKDFQIYTSKYDYLEQTFGKGIEADGVVLSKMAAVRNDEGVIIAALNGSTTGEDTTHGKILLVGGCSGVSAESFKNADTKIYEDGTIDTNSLNAHDGGKIGKFEIYEGALTTQNSDTKEYVNIDSGSLNYIKIDEIKTLVSWIMAGHIVINNVPIDAQSEQLITNILPGKIEVTYKDSSNVLNTDGISIANGVFKGLRPNIRFLSGGGTLTYLDHTIVTHADNITRTLYLPSVPQRGQEYVIIKQGNHTLKINGNGKQIHNIGLWIGPIFNTTNQGRISLVWDEDSDKWWLSFTVHI